MIDLILASNNQYKAQEIKAVVGNKVLITTLKEAGIHIDIPEPHNLLEENALEKCRVIHTLTGKNCMGEDTGLEVAVLSGEPGVRSARYAGEEGDSNKNIEKLLLNMKGALNRDARFRTIISLIFDNREFMFEGVCEGFIGHQPRGENGFGYDSVFIPAKSNKTFAEMTMEEKARYSHRKKACDKLVLFLQQGSIES